MSAEIQIVYEKIRAALACGYQVLLFIRKIQSCVSLTSYNHYCLDFIVYDKESGLNHHLIYWPGKLSSDGAIHLLLSKMQHWHPSIEIDQEKIGVLIGEESTCY